MTDVKDILQHINPSELTYEEWLSVGMALHHEGYPWTDWDTWSRLDERYRPGDCEKRWYGFDDSKGQIVTGGTIMELAKRFGFQYSSTRENKALTWDSMIAEEKDLSFIDTGWIESADIVEPKEWNPTQEMIRYLQEVFEPEEYVGFNTKSLERVDKEGKVKYQPADQGVFWKTAGQVIQELKKYDDICWVTGDYDKKAGAWIRFNPLDGKGVKNENVTSFRYALVESDSLDIGRQYALIKELQLPCKAVVASGGKSIHAIVHIGAKSEVEYRKKVDYLYKVCEANGFVLDKANKNPSRLSRLPGAERNGKKQFISLIYGHIKLCKV